MQIPCSEQELLLMQKIGSVADDLGMQAFIIGGFVRDKILGRQTKDMDIVCVGDGIVLANEVATRLGHSNAVSVFKNFGTAQFLHHDLELEFVGARKESYRAESRNPHVELGTLEDDQQRRDLTINALAVCLNKEGFGTLLDPFHGIEDLENRCLRTPLEPSKTFNDDPLRMLRTIRFASQLQFDIDMPTLQAIADCKDRMAIISQERITDELNKMIMSERPSIGFDLLFRTKLLHLIFPQMADLAGAEYIDGKGHKDNFYHTIQVLDNIANHSNNLYLRWAAILHDIGKPATKLFEPGHGWTFHNHEWIGAQMVPSIFKRLKLPLHDTMKYVQKLVLLHLRPISLTKDEITDSAMRRLLFDAGEDLEDLMTLCHADITSKNPEKVKRFKENFVLVQQRLKEVEEKDKVRNWQPPITGELIMETFQLPPGKIVGDIKLAVREAILDGVIQNNYEEAFAFMIQKANELNVKPIL